MQHKAFGLRFLVSAVFFFVMASSAFCAELFNLENFRWGMSKAEVAALQTSAKKLSDSGNRVIYEDMLFGNTFGILYDFDENGISGLYRVAYGFSKLDKNRAESIFRQLKVHISKKYERIKITAPNMATFTGENIFIELAIIKPTPDVPHYSVGVGYAQFSDTKTGQASAKCDKKASQSIINTILQSYLTRRDYSPSTATVKYFFDNWSTLPQDQQYILPAMLGDAERCLYGDAVVVHIISNGINVAKSTKHGTEIN
jgi:hypothetical protein